MYWIANTIPFMYWFFIGCHLSIGHPIVCHLSIGHPIACHLFIFLRFHRFVFLDNRGKIDLWILFKQRTLNK